MRRPHPVLRGRAASPHERRVCEPRRWRRGGPNTSRYTRGRGATPERAPPHSPRHYAGADGEGRGARIVWRAPLCGVTWPSCTLGAFTWCVSGRPAPAWACRRQGGGAGPPAGRRGPSEQPMPPFRTTGGPGVRVGRFRACGPCARATRITCARARASNAVFVPIPTDYSPKCPKRPFSRLCLGVVS